MLSSLVDSPWGVATWYHSPSAAAAVLRWSLSWSKSQSGILTMLTLTSHVLHAHYCSYQSAYRHPMCVIAWILLIIHQCLSYMSWSLQHFSAFANWCLQANHTWLLACWIDNTTLVLHWKTLSSLLVSVSLGHKSVLCVDVQVFMSPLLSALAKVNLI